MAAGETLNLENATCRCGQMHRRVRPPSLYRRLERRDFQDRCLAEVRLNADFRGGKRINLLSPPEFRDSGRRLAGSRSN